MGRASSLVETLLEVDLDLGKYRGTQIPEDRANMHVKTLMSEIEQYRKGILRQAEALEVLRKTQKHLTNKQVVRMLRALLQ